MTGPMLHGAIALSLALLWCSAAWHKFRDPAGFADAMAAYDLLPRPVMKLAARLLPCAEAAIAAALLFPATRAAAAVSGAALLLLYGGAMAINLYRGRDDFDCGCGAGQVQLVSWWLVARNIGLCILSLALLWNLENRPAGAFELLLALPAALVLCIAYVGFFSVLQERAVTERELD